MKNKKLVLQCGLFFEWRIISKNLKKLIKTFEKLRKKELILLLNCFRAVIGSNSPMFETTHNPQFSKDCFDKAMELLEDQKAFLGGIRPLQ